MVFKKFLIGSVCAAGVLGIGSFGKFENFEKYGCVNELNLVEKLYSDFDYLDSKTLLVESGLVENVLDRNLLEDKIDLALSISVSLKVLDYCRKSNGVANYSSDLSDVVLRESREFSNYALIETLKLDRDLFDVLKN